MTAPNTIETAAPTTTGTVTPGAPGTTSSAPAAPVSRDAARASIMSKFQTAAAALEDTGAGAPAGGEASAPAAGTPAAGTAAAGTPAAPAPKPEDGIELQPESGPSPELGPLKLRFKNETTGQYSNTPPIPADHKIELEVGGKTYVKDFAGVVRLAADGIANQRHASENSHIKTQVIPQYEQRLTSVQEQLEAQIALNREILSDEARYAARRQEWDALNSPEQRAERAERALEERERQATEGEQSRQHTEYYNANVLPVLHDVLAHAPTVSDEEVLGRIAMETSHMLVNGAVPPSRYPAFATYLRDQLGPWARAEHAKRSAANSTPTARHEDPQQLAEQRRRQAETRNVGTALAPAAASAGGSVVGTIQPQSQGPAKSRDEARARIRASFGAT